MNIICNNILILHACAPRNQIYSVDCTIKIYYQTIPLLQLQELKKEKKICKLQDNIKIRDMIASRLNLAENNNLTIIYYN